MMEQQPAEFVEPTDDPEEDDNALVERDAQGDVINPGTRLIEKESYERVIDGLRMAAEGCAHHAAHDPREPFWRMMMGMYDKLRRMAIQQAGLDDVIRARETRLPGASDALGFQAAHARIYEGLVQAEGGMRQLGTCHRGDFVFARMAETLASMKVKMQARMQARKRRVVSDLLWTP